MFLRGRSPRPDACGSPGQAGRGLQVEAAPKVAPQGAHPKGLGRRAEGGHRGACADPRHRGPAKERNLSDLAWSPQHIVNLPRSVAPGQASLDGRRDSTSDDSSPPWQWPFGRALHVAGGHLAPAFSWIRVAAAAEEARRAARYEAENGTADPSTVATSDTDAQAMEQQCLGVLGLGRRGGHGRQGQVYSALTFGIRAGSDGGDARARHPQRIRMHVVIMSARHHASFTVDLS